MKVACGDRLRFSCFFLYVRFVPFFASQDNVHVRLFYHSFNNVFRFTAVLTTCSEADSLLCHFCHGALSHILVTGTGAFMRRT